MTPEIAAALLDLHTALIGMVQIMMREEWPYIIGWEHDIITIERFLQNDGTVTEIVAKAKDIVSGFGIGMGSLGDTYIAEDFDASREAVQNAASLVIQTAGR